MVVLYNLVNFNLNILYLHVVSNSNVSLRTEGRMISFFYYFIICLSACCFMQFLILFSFLFECLTVCSFVFLSICLYVRLFVSYLVFFVCKMFIRNLELERRANKTELLKNLFFRHDPLRVEINSSLTTMDHICLSLFNANF
jgi:hypothetical protein